MPTGFHNPIGAFRRKAEHNHEMPDIEEILRNSVDMHLTGEHT